MTVPKDNRAIAHLALLDFMQRESQRLGFNRAVDDFVLQIADWKKKYLELMNKNVLEEQKALEEKYQKEKKEYDKKVKALSKSKKSQSIAEPQPPPQPQLATELPESVQ